MEWDERTIHLYFCLKTLKISYFFLFFFFSLYFEPPLFVQIDAINLTQINGELLRLFIISLFLQLKEELKSISNS